MSRTLLFVLAGLLMGAAIHVATILLVPSFAFNGAFARAGALGPDGAFHVLQPPTPQTNLSVPDPYMMEAVCRFVLTPGPVRITAALPSGLWSVALFDREGRNLYSFNDSAADPSGLDLVIVTPAQGLAMGDTPQSLQNAIVATLPIDAGLVVLRVFLPDQASTATVGAALAVARCNIAV